MKCAGLKAAALEMSRNEISHLRRLVAAVVAGTLKSRGAIVAVISESKRCPCAIRRWCIMHYKDGVSKHAA